MEVHLFHNVALFWIIVCAHQILLWEDKLRAAELHCRVVP